MLAPGNASATLVNNTPLAPEDFNSYYGLNFILDAVVYNATRCYFDAASSQDRADLVKALEDALDPVLNYLTNQLTKGGTGQLRCPDFCCVIKGQRKCSRLPCRPGTDC